MMRGDGKPHDFGCTNTSCRHPDHLFACDPLHCRLTMRVCVVRQLVSDVQRKQVQLWKGEGLSYPSCVTAKCVRGRRNRNILDPNRTEVWVGCGPGGRFEPSKPASVKVVELACRARLLAEGLLDEPPTMDSPPAGVPPEDDGEAWPQASIREPLGESEPEASSRGDAVEAGAERQPQRSPQGVRRVPEALPRGGRPGRVPGADGRDGGRVVRAGGGARGGTRPGLRLGEAEAGGGVERSGRRAARVGAAPSRAARGDVGR